MKQINIALVGISGVGKTTLLTTINQHIEFQWLSAGSVIASELQRQTVDRDKLRFSEIADNQALLVQGFHKVRSQNQTLTILDGHVLIHTDKTVEEISVNVFRSLKINAIIHLFADPPTIYSHRMHDTSRDRPQISIDDITDQQNFSISIANSIADDLGIPVFKIPHDGTISALEIIRSILDTAN